MNKVKVSGLLIYLLLLFCVLVVYVLWIFNPMKAETEQYDRQHNINRLEIETLSGQKVNQAQLEQRVEDLKSELNADIGFDGGVVLSDQIKSFADQSGITVTSLFISLPEDAGTIYEMIAISKLTAEIEFSGDSNSFLSFLSAVEGSKKAAFYVENASFDNEGNTGRISLFMYYQNTFSAESK